MHGSLTVTVQNVGPDQPTGTPQGAGGVPGPPAGGPPGQAGANITATLDGDDLEDGDYIITIQQDNSGISINAVTPYGTVGQHGFALGASIH